MTSRANWTVLLLTLLAGCHLPGRGGDGPRLQHLSDASQAGIGPQPSRPPLAARGLAAALMCDSERDPMRCGRQVESEVAAGKDCRIRNGRLLRVCLTDGASVTFEDADDGDAGSDFDAKQYAYLGRDTATGWHVVLSIAYESFAWLLIGADTGAITPVDGLPVLSPDSRHLLAKVFWPGSNVARVEVWAVERSGPALEWRHETTDWVPHEAAWVAEGRATVTGWRDGTRVHALIQEGDNGAWRLTEVPGQ